MNNKENLDKNFISAVIYMNTADSLDGLKAFIENLSSYMKERFVKSELIFVDDDSSDEYQEAIREYKKSNGDIMMTILHMSGRQGMEKSMNAGRDMAIGDFVFEFDECDFNFPKEQLDIVYNTCLKECDIVNCSDEKKNSAGSNTFYRLFNKYSNTEYKLESDNFRILSRRAINRIQSLNRAIPYRKALYSSCGLKLKNISYTPVRNSDYKHNDIEKKERRELAVDSLILFTQVGYKAAFILSSVMAFVMVFSAIYALIMYSKDIAIEGWTTTMLFLSFAFFGLFIILTIIIKYLSLLLELNFKKQRYMFESVEKL